jgi:transposase
MARKGIKQNSYTQKLIDKVIHEQEQEGKTANYLSKKYGIPKGTIDTWGYKKRKRGTTKRKKRGRKKQDDSANYKEKYEILKKYLEFLEEVEHEKK